MQEIKNENSRIECQKRWAGSAGIEDRAHADSKPKARKKREIATTEDGKE